MNGPAQALSLDVLFPDIGRGGFVEGYWPATPCVGRGSLERFAALVSLPEFQDIEYLVSTYRAPVTVWSPAGSEDVDPDEAMRYYHNGKAVYLDRVDRFFSPLSKPIAELERDMGVAPGSGFCNVFASPRGVTVPPHFDYDYGFNLLTKGEKTWSLCANDNVTCPMVSMGMRQEQPTAPLRPYWKGPIPNRMPEDAQTFRIAAGDVVFVPRGLWHATYAHSECVALDFAVHPPTWLDLLLAAIREQILPVEGWRQSATGIEASGDGRQAVVLHLETLLRALPDKLGAVQPEELIARVLDPKSR